MLRSPRITLLRPAFAACALLMGSFQAQALPSYARQTGQDCTTCHIGALGPQLTPYGQKFKIGGYTDGKVADWGIPLSAHLIAGTTHTRKDQPDPNEAAKSFSKNDNTAVQEVSVFVAGKLTDHIGSFTQLTYSGIEQRVGWDGVDLRYVGQTKLGGHDATFGVSLNNKPTQQDPFNTIGQWGFPYTTSDLGFGPPSAALVSGQNALYALGQNVMGLTAYAFLLDSVYIEAGGYTKLKGSTLSKLGAGRDSYIALVGVTPYYRFAYTKDYRHQNFEIGLVGLNAKVRPSDGGGAEDRFDDVGIDASYTFLGTRKHIVTVNSAFLREKQKLNYTLAEGGSDQAAQTLYSYNVNAAYYFKNTYGFTVGAFGSHGNQDPTLYADNRLSRPNTSGTTWQLDWTPTGKESFTGPAWLNYRVGLQYIAFNKYDGAHSNFDNNGAAASDNNTLLFFLWSAL